MKFEKKYIKKIDKFKSFLFKKRLLDFRIAFCDKKQAIKKFERFGKFQFINL